MYGAADAGIEPARNDTARQRRRDLLWSIGLLIAFTALAIGLTAPAWADPIHLFIGPGGDQQQTMSFFGLTQRSLAAHQNPFYTTYLNAPDGVNLAWETASPLLAVLAWPIDALFGPVAGYDVALTAAIALNGWVAAVVLHRVLGQWIGPVTGGALYAFSPFVNAHARNHLELAVLVTPPLLLLVLNRILRTRRGQWVRNGLLLAAIVVAQFYIGDEVLLIEFISTVVFVAVAAALHRHEVRTLVGSVVRTLMLAGGVAGVAVAAPLYVLFTYPQKPVGAVQGIDVYVADVANLVVPNANEAISPFSAFAGHFAGNGAEATAYVGIPLLALLAGILIWQRRDRLVLTIAITALVVAALSYGGHPHIRGHVIGGIPLPWLPFEKLPVLQDLLPVRFWIVVYLAIAATVALAVNRVRASPRRTQRSMGAFVALTAITFFPALPWLASGPAVPAFFTHDEAHIPSASVVLLAPLPYDLQPDAELWQTWAGNRFKIVGGYAHGPEYEHPRTLPLLGGAMYSMELGRPQAPADAAGIAGMRAELARNQIHTVILGPAAQHDALESLLTGVCGRVGAPDQGVEVWWSCSS